MMQTVEVDSVERLVEESELNVYKENPRVFDYKITIDLQKLNYLKGQKEVSSL